MICVFEFGDTRNYWTMINAAVLFFQVWSWCKIWRFLHRWTSWGKL